MLQAPNRLADVAFVMHSHPEIDRMSEATRGTIVDLVAHQLNAGDPRKPWGRKSRDRKGTDLNTDGLTFLRTDVLFEIIDIISGVDGSATWDEAGVFGPGENGFWVPPRPDQPPVTPVDPGPSLWDSMKKLQQDLAEVQDKLAAVNQRNVNLEQSVKLLERSVENLIKVSYPPETARQFRVEGKTEVSYGHQHKINLTVRSV